MTRSRQIGLVLESQAFDTPVAAVPFGNALRTGAFVMIELSEKDTVLAMIRGVRSAGGVFTPEKAAYHLKHLEEAASHVDSTYAIAELSVVAHKNAAGEIDDKNRALRPGSPVREPTVDELRQFLRVPKFPDLPLGVHASHGALNIGVEASDLSRGHVAVIGQTGSGKTNVLRLLHRGMAASTAVKTNYVIFDFHDEFEPVSPSESLFEPPLTFGPGDISFEAISELLPGLSLAQRDLLSMALDRAASTSISSLVKVVESIESNESTRRVLLRRLMRLDRAGAYVEKDDATEKLMRLLARPGAGVIIRLGAVQTEIAHVFISSFVRRLMVERMAGRLPRVALVVDEAHRLMSDAISPTGARGFRMVAQEGRKFGVVLVLATQRPSLVDATVLSQCATIVALRVTSPDDAKAVTHVMNDLRSTDLANLSTGEGIISRGWNARLLWVRFDEAPRTQLPETPAGLRQTILDA